MHGWKNPNDLFKNFEAVVVSSSVAIGQACRTHRSESVLAKRDTSSAWRCVVVDGHPLIRRAILADMPETGKRDMRRRDEIATFGSKIQHLASRVLRGMGIAVVLDGCIGDLQLDRSHMHDIAPREQPLRRTPDHIGTVPRRMPR